MLYLRGDREYEPIEPCLEGLRAAGLRRVEGELIPNGGHWSSEEQPDAVVAALRAFMASSGSV
ncbi:alpha/beta fold hydrolase [Cohnella sp. REN36]|uniref:alpha/beta fold hydrolase n=1 Tax=Cohnella sp. REN36 TaxID=2887347 RepID=UPI001D1544D1|nr:alpha/beta hydrolase [Cohnella sp. REN36]MCC3372536.1 alpha/beta hydrolase [Cohnella sp. REN36]